MILHLPGVVLVVAVVLLPTPAGLAWGAAVLPVELPPVSRRISRDALLC